jgi:enoyl-[acyl-carrier protein] reductase I
MYNLLKGKKGIIFGALDEKSIAWHIAERCAEEGAEFILSNTPAALRFGSLKTLAEKTNSEIVAADATNLEDLNAVFTRAMEKFGGQIDFVLHAIGMSLNVRKNRSYDDVDYNYYTKTMDISAFSFHKMLQTAYKLDAIKEWGSVVALSYVAGQRTFYRYNDMADAKALLESIARSFGYIYGRERKVRINTISQSPTLTTAGSGVKGIDNLMDYSDRMSPLGNATAEDCANYCVTLFSDLTKKITMQNLYNDGGFSSMGMSQKAMHVYNASLEKIVD